VHLFFDALHALGNTAMKLGFVYLSEHMGPNIHSGSTESLKKPREVMAKKVD
jgi:hypothetical protein